MEVNMLRAIYEREMKQLKMYMPRWQETGQVEDDDDADVRMRERRLEGHRIWARAFAEWEAAVRDLDEEYAASGRWLSRVEILKFRRARLKRKLRYERGREIVQFTGQFYNSGLYPSVPYPHELICPVWFAAMDTLYDMPCRLGRAERTLRMVKLEEAIARLDIRISILTYKKCNCRYWFRRHWFNCPARDNQEWIPLAQSKEKNS
jgi:hypothetical protein